MASAVSLLDSISSGYRRSSTAYISPGDNFPESPYGSNILLVILISLSLSRILTATTAVINLLIEAIGKTLSIFFCK